MAEEIGSLAVKIGLDSSGFQGGISNINRELKVLDSEFKANTAALGASGKGMEGLKIKADSLAKTIDLQKQKVATLETAYNKSVATKRKDAKATQELEIKLNNAKAALSNTETALAQANKEIDSAIQKTGLLGQVLDKTGINAGTLKTAFGAIGVAAGSYLKGAVTSATSAEKSTATLANVLKNQGLSADEAGAKIKEFQKKVTDMSSFSGGEAREALQTLAEKGIGVGESLQWSSTIADVAIGSNKSLSESASLVADAYHGKARALVSLGILSKEEVKQLGDSEDATISMEEVQRRLNAQFGGAATAELGTYSGKMKENENTINSAKTAIGTALLPILATLADALAKILVPIADFIKQNPQFTAAVFAIVAVLGTLIGGLSVFNTVTSAMGTMGTMFSGVGIAAGGMILPILAVIAIIGVLAFSAYEIIKHWDQIKTFFSGLWAGVTATFNSALNFIKTAPGQALDTAKAAISSKIESIKATVAEKIDAIKNIFKNMFSGGITLPKIKLPHFSISGSFSLNPPSIPTFGVNWYDKGAVFNGPSVIGVGEKRPEFVGALDDLRYLIRSELQNAQGTGAKNIEVNINNPVAETGTESTRKQLTRLAYMGVI